MSITRDCVVTIHYTFKDDAGEIIDSSVSAEPLAYLHGHGNLVPGLERELEGKKAGDRVNVTVSAADGYGEYDERLVQQVPRRALSGLSNIRVGMKLQTQTAEGPRTVVVTSLVGDMVTLDANHPLAGKTLTFDIEIMDVRQATAEELSHGHVHGPGDDHHHH